MKNFKSLIDVRRRAAEQSRSRLRNQEVSFIFRREPMPKGKSTKTSRAIWCIAVSCLISVLFVSTVSALTITSTVLPNGEVGVPYNFELQISGGVPPYNIEVTKCCLPPGLGPDPESSTITGTPELAKAWRFKLTVTDGLSATVTRNFKIKILKPVAITTKALKAGKVGKKYVGTLKAAGGKKPYTWSLISGTLPEGVSFDAATGKLAGIPTEGGSTDVTFQATDDLGAIHQASFTIAGIGPPPRPLPPLSDDPAARLRGATIDNSYCCWSDPNYPGWKYMDRFPRWGGNVFSLMFKPFLQGEPVLPGQSLTKRLMKALEQYVSVMDWALQRNMHVILRFHTIEIYPRTPFRIWPDDGRVLWTDASAQDEFVQAWADLAKHFKGKKGIIFNLLTEPQPWRDAIPQDIGQQVWNTLILRLIEAIRAEDPERWIIVEPLTGDANAFADLVVSTDPKVMYEFHFYESHLFTCQGCGDFFPPAGTVTYPGWTPDVPWEPTRYWDKSALEQALLPAINFRDAHNVRVIAGEFGTVYYAPMDSRIRWTTDVIDLLEAYGFDWAYFIYGAVASGDGWSFEGTPFESVVTSKYALNLPP